MVQSFVSISTKLIALVLVVSIASIVVTTILAFNFADYIIKNNLKESLREESTVRGESISSAMRMQINKLENLAQTSIIQQTIDDLNPALDDVTFHSIASEKEDLILHEVQQFQLNEFTTILRDLKIINHQGRLIYSLNENISPHAFITGNFQIATPQVEFVQDRNKSLFVEFSVPINRDSHSVGIIVATTDGSILDDILLNRYELHETGQMYLVNKDGVMITESQFMEDSAFNQGVNTMPVTLCFQNGETVDGMTYQDYRGIDIFGLSYCDRELNFVLLTEVDESIILEPIIELQQRIVIVSALLIAIVSAITYILSRRLSTPLLRLKTAANEISSGNFDVRTKIETNDEIGQLSSAFDNMAKTIQETVSAITKRENLIKRQENILLNFFQERENCCICLVDLIGSSRITASLSVEHKRKYFEIFTNGVVDVINKHHGITVKFIDDAILFYFPVPDNNDSILEAAVVCCLEISELEKELNKQMTSEGLPGISYRISSTFGTINVAKTSNSVIQDIFGEPVNHCFKINPYALPNTVLIGEALYERMKNKNFKFTKLDKSIVEQLAYQVYIVSRNSA